MYHNQNEEVSIIYNKIAEGYIKSHKLPYRLYIEKPSFVNLLSQVTANGQCDIIDLACGGGEYTRIASSFTNGQVYGIDISPEMIQLAKSYEGLESNQPNKYILGDCSKNLNLNKIFDVVTATYLLNYSPNYEVLLSFCKSAYELLKPGGVFLGLNLNPFLTNKEQFNRSHRYQQIIATVEDEILHDGDIVQIQIMVPDYEVKFFNYFWQSQTYEKAFNEAGFKDFSWIKQGLHGEGLENNQKYWDEYVLYNPTIIFKAKKQ